MKLLLRFLSGPAALLLVYAIPLEGLSHEARIALAIFGWMILWWMTQPVPWGITSLLPLALLPAFAVMDTTQAAALYGQRIFFFLWGTSLVGYALNKSGLARRFALQLLSVRGMSTSVYHVCFGLMVVAGLLSWFITDVAVVALMMPVGISVVAWVREHATHLSQDITKVGAFIGLGILYGAVAGGKATIAGITHNALSVALLEEVTGRMMGWFNWMMAGVPIFLAMLACYFLVLRVMMPIENPQIPGGKEMIQREREKLGPLSAAERMTLFIFSTMALLFMLPTFFALALGVDHELAQWAATIFNLWSVPVIVLLILFTVPVDWSRGQALITWNECVENTPWDIMLLVTGAVAVTSALVQFGFTEFIGNAFGQLNLGTYVMPFVSAYVVAVGTNFMSGTAATSLFASMLIPAAQAMGFNPASMAMVIPNVATGLIFPWSGATPGLAFASGLIEMGPMIRVGVAVTLIGTFLMAGIHIMFSPIL